MLSHQVRRKVKHLRAVRDEFVLAVVAAHDQHLAEDLIKNKKNIWQFNFVKNKSF